MASAKCNNEVLVLFIINIERWLSKRKARLKWKKVGLMNQLLKMMQKYPHHGVKCIIRIHGVWDNENSTVEDQRITMKSVYDNMGVKSSIDFISRNLNANTREESSYDYY